MEDTGEPFLIGFQENEAIIFATTAGDAVISVVAEVETVHPIDPKYIDLPPISYNSLLDKPTIPGKATTVKSGTVKVALFGEGDSSRFFPVGSIDNTLYLFGPIHRGEGSNSVILGVDSGNTANVASGWTSLAVNSGTSALGRDTVAANSCTVAEGAFSSSFGGHTYAGGEYQFVLGRANIKDTENKYILIVGNYPRDSTLTPTDETRSNAHTLDWEGNAWYAGTVEGTGVIVKSSTEGSTKRFKITVDDSGTLTATEVS